MAAHLLNDSRGCVDTAGSCHLHRTFASPRSSAVVTLAAALPLLLLSSDRAESAEPAPKNSAGTLQSIEAVRGGRHWVDAPTAPPRSPEDSLNALQIEPGLKIELFASEPLVMDPVAMEFDRRGRMFVVEYGDYPIGPPNGQEPLSRIVLLEDTDGDHRADRRTVFARALNFAHSLMPWKDGLLVGAQTQLLFLKDVDDDGVADVREVVFDGFVAAHPQMQIGNPRWGFDNRIYCNYGPGEITSPYRPGQKINMPQRDFRFDPLTFEAGPASGMGQYGNTFDNFGHRFFCTNRNPIITELLPPHAAQRNPYATVSTSQYDVGVSGGDTRVYPLVEMKSNYLEHAGTHTSACGVTACQSPLFGPEFEHSVFVCEPIGHLVTRSLVTADGPVLTSERARPKADFVASSDTWFRPASLTNGPDGAMYLADMYRLWVEHPKFLPPDIAEKLDWRAGEDRGRIYRIVPEKPAVEFSPPQTTADQVALLASPNGWQRRLGQRLLVESTADAVAAENVRTLLNQHSEETTRLHAVWTLAGLQQLTRVDIFTALRDASPIVRRAGVQLADERIRTIDAKRWHEEAAVLLAALSSLARDENAAVRFELTIALGDFDPADPEPEQSAAISQSVSDLLATIARHDGDDARFQTALLTSSARRSASMLATLLADADFINDGNPGRQGLVRELATVTGHRSDPEEINQVLAALRTATDRPAWWQTAVLTGLATGLPRYRGDLGRLSLTSLLTSPPEALVASAQTAQKLMQQMQAVAVERDASLNDRIAAIELISHQAEEQWRPVFEPLLDRTSALDVQLAVSNALQRIGSDAAADIVRSRWSELGPQVRDSAVSVLFRRASSTLATLQAMQRGEISPAVASIDLRIRLLKSTDEPTRRLAEDLFGGAVSANRREVADTYRASLDLQGSIDAGRQVFTRMCARCHRIDGQGHEVGPDISDVRNRSREALLFDILDPNSKVEPRFAEYSVVTNDGRVTNGLMISESADSIVLRQAENKEAIIARDDIDILRASGKSLMPEGVEKDITLQQMSDLLEFLKQR